MGLAESNAAYYWVFNYRQLWAVCLRNCRSAFTLTVLTTLSWWPA